MLPRVGVDERPVNDSVGSPPLDGVPLERGEQGSLVRGDGSAAEAQVGSQQSGAKPSSSAFPFCETMPMIAFGVARASRQDPGRHRPA